MARLRPHCLRTGWTKILKFDWWVFIDVDHIIAKEFFYFFLVNLYTAQKHLGLDGLLPTQHCLSQVNVIVYQLHY